MPEPDLRWAEANKKDLWLLPETYGQSYVLVPTTLVLADGGGFDDSRNLISGDNEHLVLSQLDQPLAEGILRDLDRVGDGLEKFD